MIPAATREAQALACLAAADHHRQPLLALATKLTGSAEEGMNLYQQALLDCHDAIQRNGFTGERYEFYLYTAIKRLRLKHSKQQRRQQALPDDFERTYAAPHEPDVNACQLLAEQVMAEVRQRFSPADRLVLRLHVDGCSPALIAELIGRRDRTWIWRRLDRMKHELRQLFAQAWQALGEPDDFPTQPATERASSEGKA